MKKFKVIWVSSYLPRLCGIAYYSANYISALRNYAKKSGIELDLKIVAHTDAQADYPVIDNLKNKKWHKKVFEIIKKEKPDVVHFQHEYGLYETFSDGNERVLELLKMLKEAGIPVVMTYHSVYKKLGENFSHFMSESLKNLGAGIVHEQYQADNLPKNIGWKPNNIFVLPHGSDENVWLDRKKIRREFGYDGDFVVGSAGLADERKGFRTLVRQWPKVVKKFPRAILALELKPHFSEQTRIYINKVLQEVMRSSVSSNIEFSVRYYTNDEFYRRLASFDILVLPYRSESQSGVLAHGFSTGTPAIVTDIEGLGAEIRNSGAGIAVKNRNKVYKAIIKLLKDEKMRKKFSRNALDYVKKVNGWSIIAKKTFGIWGRASKSLQETHLF